MGKKGSSKKHIHNPALQYHLQTKKGDIGEYVILPGDPFRTDLIASFLDKPKLVAHNRELKTWTGYLDGVKVSVTSTGMGCPSAAIAVEELIKCGAKTLIRVGTAGRVSKESKNKKVDGVICIGAVRDEYTSAQYVPSQFPALADRHVVDAMVKAAKKFKYNYIEGITHCKDSYYGQVEPETMPNYYELVEGYKIWEDAGVACTEMETAIIMVLASLRKCRAGSIMTFNDVTKSIKVVIEAIRTLIKEGKHEN